MIKIIHTAWTYWPAFTLCSNGHQALTRVTLNKLIVGRFGLSNFKVQFFGFGLPRGIADRSNVSAPKNKLFLVFVESIVHPSFIGMKMKQNDDIGNNVHINICILFTNRAINLALPRKSSGEKWSLSQTCRYNLHGNFSSASAKAKIDIFLRTIITRSLLQYMTRNTNRQLKLPSPFKEL